MRVENCDPRPGFSCWEGPGARRTPRSWSAGTDIGVSRNGISITSHSKSFLLIEESINTGPLLPIIFNFYIQNIKLSILVYILIRKK